MTKTYAATGLESDTGPSVKDYIMLMKPRVMSLVVFTAFCGLWIAPGKIHPVIAFAAILFVTIGAGSAAAINMWYDRDIDAIMKRTQKRPIITGAIEADEALSFGVITGVISVLLMALCVNIISAGLLALTILYYVFIYTMWLKRSSVQNVVIGGAAGAFPPMIGWAAVTGDISLQSFTLFAIIFMWTPPHSWALALFRLQDYRDCSVPMMPVIKGEAYTKKQIILYSILMVVTVAMPYFLQIANIGYLVISSVMSIIFLYHTFLLFDDKDFSKAKKLFWFSILYLFIIFLSLIVLKV
ncbi:MAG: heme o synthase [Rickettsiaceae bacterium]|nr:heme o synthase [Rickettsiaceae bacterium]MDP4832341.1 heme o synthase [Rickettsiaceae bacterium]MDP5020181.1 heme o synthase [Rickettsiaceae bacterium]MDP5082923.1 heme o synthase [Rickettsiaceae bacterium]